MALRVVQKSRASTKKITKVRPLQQARKYAVPYSGNEMVNMMTLPSGIRVITSSGPEKDVASVGVYVYSGSAFENDANNGVSNLLKNLVPLGNAKTTQAQRASEVEKAGANIKVSVGRDLTSFVGEGLASAVPTLFRVLSEVAHPQQFTDAQLDAAKKQVQAEKKGLTHEAILSDYLHSAAFQSTSFAQSVLGENSSVKSLTSASVEDFITKNFTSNRVVIVGTGVADFESFVQTADKHFSTLPKGAPIPTHPHVEYTGSEIKIRDDTFHNLYVTIGFEAPGINDRDFWGALVYQEILGSWNFYHGSAPYNTSIVGETMAREKLGTKFNTFYNPYGDTGLLGYHFETSESAADNCTYEILNSVQKIYANLSPEELQGAKNRAIARVLRNAGSNKSQHLGQFGVFSKRAISTAEIVGRLEAVQKSDIYSLIQTYLYDTDPTVIAHGPIEEFPEYNLIRGWTYWNRW